jgi:adenosine deaminase
MERPIQESLSTTPRQLSGFFCNLADLHVHLGATTSPHFLWELAHKQGLRLPEKDYHQFIKQISLSRKSNHSQYLKKIGKQASDSKHSPFNITHTIQSSPFAIEECVHTAIAGAYRKSGITRIELRFNPMFRNKNGEHDLDKVILSAVMGMQRATIEYPIKAGIIFESDRQFTKEQHLIIVQKAIHFKAFGIVGLDISGPNPPQFSIDTLVEAFDLARKNGLKTTMHTGEFTGYEEMWEVVKKLKPNRIGHGIKSTDDPKLVQYLAQQKIPLELCPSSNIITGVVSGWEELTERIGILKRAGVILTINSDGPEFMQTDVNNELNLLIEHKAFTLDEIPNLITNSHTHSFI